MNEKRMFKPLDELSTEEVKKMLNRNRLPPSIPKNIALRNVVK